MRAFVILLVTLVALLSCLVPTTASAQGSGDASDENAQEGISSDPTDPEVLLQLIEKRRKEREALIPFSPLGRLRDHTDRAKQHIYEATGIKLGVALNNLGQTLSQALPDEATSGLTTDMDFTAKWEVIDRGKPTHGGFYFQLEGRWDYKTTGPQDLGFVSLASAGGTANAFSAYTPEAFLVRNLYWQHGSREAGWAYRIGKITPDSILLSSSHISPTTTFLPNVGTGVFAAGFPDSGLGIVGARFIEDRAYVAGLISDANGNRFNFGDIGAGDYYKALEVGIKIAPRTKKAGYSKFDLWHTDGTKDGLPINAMTGREGWGFATKLEQELTDDGRAVGVFRYGRSFNGSSIYKQQAGLSLLFYDPSDPLHIKNDLVGVAFNWVDSVVVGSRDEYNFETFYRFPLFPLVDATLSYQSVIHPALTTELDHASAFSLRLRTTF